MSAPRPFQRETVEFLPVTVLVNGTVTSDPVEFSITDVNSRPSAWGAAVTIGTDIGVMVNGTALGGPGTFNVYARVTSSPETPVVDCGTFRIV